MSSTLIAARSVKLQSGVRIIEIEEGSRVELYPYYDRARLYPNCNIESDNRVEISWCDMHKIFDEFFPYQGRKDETPRRLPAVLNYGDCDEIWCPTWEAIERNGGKLEIDCDQKCHS